MHDDDDSIFMSDDDCLNAGAGILLGMVLGAIFWAILIGGAIWLW